MSKDLRYTAIRWQIGFPAIQTGLNFRTQNTVQNKERNDKTINCASNYKQRRFDVFRLKHRIFQFKSSCKHPNFEHSHFALLLSWSCVMCGVALRFGLLFIRLPVTLSELHTDWRFLPNRVREIVRILPLDWAVVLAALRSPVRNPLWCCNESSSKVAYPALTASVCQQINWLCAKWAEIHVKRP